MTPQFWLWLDVVLMSLGGATLLVIGKRRTPTEEAHTALHGIVPFIAACAYLSMAVGQGVFALPVAGGGTREFFFARYIDWTFTTPLLLVALSMGSALVVPRRVGTIGAMVVADLMMIVTAFLFALSTDESLKWIWFVISCVAFLPIYWVLWRPLLEDSLREREDVRKAYRDEALMLSVLWFGYPVILFLGQDGTRILGPTASVALIAILDLFSKPVFGFVSVRNRTRIEDRAAGTAASAPRPAAVRPVAA